MSNPEGGRQPNPNESNGLKSQSRRNFLETALGAGAAFALGGVVDGIINTNNLIHKNLELRKEYDPLSANELGKALEIYSSEPLDEASLSQTKKQRILKRVRETISYDKALSEMKSENTPRFLLDSVLALAGLVVGFFAMDRINKEESTDVDSKYF